MDGNIDSFWRITGRLNTKRMRRGWSWLYQDSIFAWSHTGLPIWRTGFESCNIHRWSEGLFGRDVGRSRWDKPDALPTYRSRFAPSSFTRQSSRLSAGHKYVPMLMSFSRYYTNLVVWTHMKLNLDTHSIHLIYPDDLLLSDIEEFIRNYFQLQLVQKRFTRCTPFQTWKGTPVYSSLEKSLNGSLEVQLIP